MKKALSAIKLHGNVASLRGGTFYCKIVYMATKYFEKNYIKDYDSMSDTEKKEVFLNAVKDFYDRKIDVYKLSNVGEFIWSSSVDKSTDLADIGMEASELEYYLHAQDEGGFGNATGRVLDSIEKYYLLHRGSK